MNASSFRYEFTFHEFIYFFFKKKICPKCGAKLEKHRCFEIVDGSVFDANTVPLYITNCQVKHYFYRFTCQGCGVKFTLSELSK